MIVTCVTSPVSRIGSRTVRRVDTTAAAHEAADALRATIGEPEAVWDVALVMGSGWLPAADALGEPEHEIALADLPGFSAPAVAGHGGTLRSVRVGDKRLLLFLGRTHFYEGKGVAAVVHGVRTAAAAGVRTLVLTNGCGGLNPAWSPGTPVLIRDHINMTMQTPLEGPTFIDLTDLYSQRLRDLVHEVDPSLDEGVYLQLTGPQYETPAEIGMIRALGGDLVGMSTALEAIAAREAGLEVLGLSLVTNAAAGMTGEPLNHAEVLEAGQAAAARMGALLSDVIPRI
ncbi:purine-nucleoside phosphorylase [Aeromicrobium sp. CF3.5]|uniref:purine-nucleoside phosphorylase n=1 Tax=Aeromicrobium sp. CF3.5 TaxID=3373078 RepID=UPI003EE7033E